jgi:hypothetical protein
MEAMKIKATELNEGMTILATINSECSFLRILKGATNGKSIELKINSIEVQEPTFIKGRGVNGKKSKTDYSSVILQSERGEIKLGKNLKITVIN